MVAALMGAWTTPDCIRSVGIGTDPAGVLDAVSLEALTWVLIVFIGLIGGVFFIARNVIGVMSNLRNRRRNGAERRPIEALSGPILISIAYCAIGFVPPTPLWPLAFVWLMDPGTWSLVFRNRRRAKPSK